MSFSENLKEVMHSLSITTTELALTTGISENTLNSYLRSDGSIPTADKAVKIADALNTSVEFLVKGFEKKSSLPGNFDMHKLCKYAEVINNLDEIPERERNPLITYITDIAPKFGK